MKELRCILFTDREVLSAILDRKRRLKEPMPVGPVTGIALEKHEEGVRAHVVIDRGREQLIVPESDLQAALLSHCMAKNVPLPVEADKSVYLIRGRATLMITMNFNKAARLVEVAAAADKALPPH